MELSALFRNKTIKAKAKATMLASLLINRELSVDRLAEYASTAKNSEKSICIEAIEFAVKAKPDIATDRLFDFVIQALDSQAPRSKWEAGKIVGHLAERFKNRVQDAIPGLLDNTRDNSTVVRWSAAYALGEIAALKTKCNRQLIPAIKEAITQEEKNSIVKIYMQALRKSAKKDQ